MSATTFVSFPVFTLVFFVLCSSLLLCLSVPVPVDLYSSYDEIKRTLPAPLSPNSPGLCPENLNNDNITNIKWYRFHNGTGKCWHIDQRGPCGQNMLFYRIGDSDYGECDCNFYYRCARPLIYWAPEKRCYFTNDQGPCKNNEWLIVKSEEEEGGDGESSSFQPICVANPCLRNQTLQPSRKDRYWFEHNGECYLTLSRGYCSHPDEVLYTKWDELNPSCHIGRECNLRRVRGAKLKSSNVPAVGGCLPGQKLDGNGDCRKLLRVSWWSVLAKKKK